ncbi:hypothetical protein KC19_5G039300 [Ceratodon purpureus]|uniref:Uncharacterized protein n=1 Tax=Ceratodon purpureus TaxID=3225 RepID=A0A8T0HZ27_CERPU|nr:hypothetical protein KC19_5G039300 [Ceratodon purpureus]
MHCVYLFIEWSILSSLEELVDGTGNGNNELLINRKRICFQLSLVAVNKSLSGFTDL